MKRIAMLLVVCTIADVLPTIRPGAEWTIDGDTYAGLNWTDRVQAKPTLQEIQQAQTDCQATLTPAGILAGQRAGAITELNTGTQPLTKLQRAVFLVELDEINLLRQRDVDRSADVAASTSLADLKARWAARSTLSDRTAVQFRNAVMGRVNSGASD